MIASLVNRRPSCHHLEMPEIYIYHYEHEAIQIPKVKTILDIINIFYKNSIDVRMA